MLLTALLLVLVNSAALTEQAIDAAGKSTDKPSDTSFTDCSRLRDLTEGRMYAQDTLLDGCYPLYGSFGKIQVFNAEVSKFFDARNVRVDFISGDHPAEQKEFLKVTDDDQLRFNYYKMNTPGVSEWSVHLEGGAGVRDGQLTIRVIDQKDDPEWVQPAAKIELFAEPGEMLHAYDVVKQCTDLACRQCQFVDVPGVEYPGPDISFAQPGEYSFRLMIEWGSFFTMTDVTAHVYPKEEQAGRNETVVVKNAAELGKAINETRANTILISEKYRHGKTGASSPVLSIHGDRTVTISPETGDTALIDGGLYLIGSGNVILDRVSIEPKESCGLCLSGGIHVTAGTVRGAASGTDSGCPAVIADSCTLKIDEAIGGEGKNGIGGDGIYAAGNCEIEVGSARGGNASNGFGGSGVVALNGARVNVTGEATGGDGPGAAGKAVLIGLDGHIDVKGETRDGIRTESKKPVKTEEITSYALLQHALRSGQTEIHLSSRFRNTEKNWNAGPGRMTLFAAGEKTVHISGPEGGKPVMLDCTFIIRCGSWKFSGIDLNTRSKDSTTLLVAGSAEVEWNGNITSATNCAIAEEAATLTINGNLQGKNSDYSTVIVRASSTVEINGSITTPNKPVNALYIRGGKVRMKGNVNSNPAIKNQPSVYILYGVMELSGDIESKNTQAVLINHGGSMEINGRIRTQTDRASALYARKGRISVQGSVEAPHPAFSQFAGESAVWLNGERID